MMSLFIRLFVSLFAFVAFFGCGGDTTLVDGDCPRCETVTSVAGVVFRGPEPAAYFGWSVAGAGDVNGDGYADMLIGAPFANGPKYVDVGAAYVVTGGPSSALSGGVIGDVAAMSVFGDLMIQKFGASVSACETELLVGSPGLKNPFYPAGSGYAFGFVRGQVDLSDNQMYVHELSGEVSGNDAGAAVAQLDLNNDGVVDYVIGAPYADGGMGMSSGVVYVVYGPLATDVNNTSLSTADLKIVGQTDFDLLGTSLASAGDVNGDGCDDLLMGAPWYSPNNEDLYVAGGVFLWYGRGPGCSNAAPLTGTVSVTKADVTLIGELAYARIGSAGGIAGAGDVNDDGYDDVLISSVYSGTKAAGQGITYLQYGGPTLAGTISVSAVSVRLIGESESDFSGWSLAVAGDVNGDGFSDLLIGARKSVSDADAGAVYVVLGSDILPAEISLRDANRTFTGEVAGGLLGYSVAWAGDVNGDGYDDMLIGAPGEEDNTGAAHLLFGGEAGAP